MIDRLSERKVWRTRKNKIELTYIEHLTISSYVSVRSSGYEARGQFGEHERCVRVARGVATQFLLKAITWQNIKLCRNGKFHVERDACRRKIDGKIVAFLSSVVYYFKDLLKSGKRAFVQHKKFISL